MSSIDPYRHCADPIAVSVECREKSGFTFARHGVQARKRLLTRRFRLENELDVDVYQAVSLPRRGRFNIAGAIFQTEAILSRYQY